VEQAYSKGSGGVPLSRAFEALYADPATVKAPFCYFFHASFNISAKNLFVCFCFVFFTVRMCIFALLPQAMFSLMDADRNGTVDFAEFEAMVTFLFLCSSSSSLSLCLSVSLSLSLSLCISLNTFDFCFRVAPY